MTSVALPGESTESAASTARPRAVWRSDVQALRALAVCAVVAYHVWPRQVPGGFIGVDVFFVISGFVVGGALANEAIASGRVGLLAFAARRVRRLAPSVLVVIVATLIASAVVLSPIKQILWGGDWQRPSVTKDAIASALWVPNLWFMAQDRPYDQAGTESPYLHFWSLGVEAQYYVLMPALAVLVALAWRRERRLGLIVAGALGLVMFDGGLVLQSVTGDSPFFNPLARLWEFWFGVAVALGMACAGSSHRRLRTLAAAVAWIVLVVMFVAAYQSPGWPNAMALVPVGATALVLAMNTPAIGALRALDSRGVQRMGDWSFAIYLVHWPVIVLGVSLAGRPLAGWDALWILPATALGTFLVVKFVESPWRKRAIGEPRARRRLLVLFAGATAVVVLLACAVGFYASTASVASGDVARAYTPIPVSDRAEVADGAVPINVRPSLADAGNDTASEPSEPCEATSASARDWRAVCTYGPHNDGAPLVVLVGDSHAQQWVDALVLGAERGDYALKTLTVEGCSPLDGLSIADRDEPCAQWRDWMRDELGALDPDLIVVSTSTHYMIDDDPAGDDAYLDALPTFLDAVPEGASLAWVSDTPLWPEDPVECLVDNQQAMNACTLDADSAFRGALLAAMRHALEGRGYSWLAYTEFMCAAQCPPILDDVLLYRDDDHVSATFAAELAPVVSADIAAIAQGTGP